MAAASTSSTNFSSNLCSKSPTIFLCWSKLCHEGRGSVPTFSYDNDDDDGGDDDDDGGDDDDVDLEKNLISAGGKPVASGSVGADVGSVGMAALILVLVLVLHK